MQQKEIQALKNMANTVRFLSLDMITKAKSGHPGFPMGMAKVSSVLFAKHLNFSTLYPKWENRDRFILSAGHGSSLLYSLLYLVGYKDINLDDLKNFRQLGSKTTGHPEYKLLDGVETTTGPLGQGIATAVGIAMASKIKNEKLGNLIDNKVYVLAGDGCLMEGISEEAISFAGAFNLNNLIVLWDNNNITIDGKTDITTKTNMQLRFKANGWETFEIKNGYDIEEIDATLNLAKNSKKPAFIDIHTIIGKGYSKVENTSTIHGSPLSEEQLVEAKIESGYNIEPFTINEATLKYCREAGNRNDKIAEEWYKNISSLNTEQKAFLNSLEGKYSYNLDETFTNLKKYFIDDNFEKATRNANAIILEKFNIQLPYMIGGSADLSTPTCVKTKETKNITKENFTGNFIPYGIREHLMGAVMNGLNISGIRTFGSTFLTFSDYLKPAIRLSALMKQNVIYLFTHDSVFVGEDGPTHQPIEQLAGLRSIPNINIIRPADAIESVEAWEIAIKSLDTPTAIIFSRQKTPLIRNVLTKENKSIKGAYIISQADKNKLQNITLIATGTEVATAIEVQKILLNEYFLNSSVVSMPSFYLFDKQAMEYQKNIIPPNTTTISIEASSTFGWSKYAKINIGIDEFGTSAPGEKLKTYFNFTPNAIATKIKGLL